MSAFLFKRGDSFVVTADVLDSTDAPVDLTGSIIASQLRDAVGTLIAELVAAHDPAVSNRIRLSFAGDTGVWPIGTLRGDVQITWADASRNTSETMQITVVDRITTG